MEYLEADYEFHMYIAECTENSFLYDMIDRVNFVTKRFHILSGNLDLYIQTALEEHQAVVDAIMEDRYRGCGHCNGAASQSGWFKNAYKIGK